MITGSQGRANPEAAGSSGGDRVSRRQRWMAALARASASRLEDALTRLAEAPIPQMLRPPEIGTIMVQARAGGTGGCFHLGEMTVTRCAVLVHAADGAALVGQGYVAGRDKRHAELAAVFDAMLQDPARHDALERDVIGPLVEAEADRRRRVLAQAAATRVDFFTLARGD